MTGVDWLCLLSSTARRRMLLSRMRLLWWICGGVLLRRLVSPAVYPPRHPPHRLATCTRSIATLPGPTMLLLLLLLLPGLLPTLLLLLLLLPPLRLLQLRPLPIPPVVLYR